MKDIFCMEKIYNLCNEEEYKLFNIDNPDVGIGGFEYLQKKFLYCYSDCSGYFYRLDGPAYELKEDGKQVFYTKYGLVSEEQYWKDPDVIKYKYLKEHPELKAFI